MATTTRELERFAAHQRRIENLLELPAERLLEQNSEVSEWSTAKQLFHITLANELSLNNVAALIAEKGMFIRPLEPLDPRVEEILERGIYPRGASAPRFVRPPEKVDMSVLRQLIADVRTALDGLTGRASEIDAAPNAIPHQRLGTLTAVQWVHFARMHSAHHLLLARAILRAD